MTAPLLLVVDDDPIVRNLVGRILEQAGYRCIVVESAMEALHELERRHRDVALVLTDIVMPGESGLALGEQITERWPEVPVAYMSGYTPEALRRQGVELPAEFIGKPFTIEELVSNVAAALERSPLERRTGERRGGTRATLGRRTCSPLK